MRSGLLPIFMRRTTRLDDCSLGLSTYMGNLIPNGCYLVLSLSLFG
jgi:hypothetical protein